MAINPSIPAPGTSTTPLSTGHVEHHAALKLAVEQVDTAFEGHVAAADPHPQYTTSAEAGTIASGAVSGHIAQADPHPQYTTEAEAAAAAAAAVSGHTSAADPHSQYTTDAEAGTIAAAAVSGHTSAADPHPQYTTEAEATAAAGALVTAHEAALDPHPQYLTTQEGTLLYEALGNVGAGIGSHLIDPDPHTQYQKESERGQANGYAALDGAGKVPTSQLPALAVTSTSVVASEAAMLALVAQPGDVAIRTDTSKSFILTAEPATTLANWQELLAPPSPVLSVDGRTGTISLSDLYAASNDPRLTNSRTPTAHKSTHATGGTDALAPSDIGAAATGSSNTFSAPQVIQTSGATDVGLTVRSGAGATGNILEARDSASTPRLTVTPTGYTTTNNVQSNGGVRVGSGVSYSTNQNWVAIQTAVSVPASVTSGAILYVASNGQLRVRTALGDVGLTVTSVTTQTTSYTVTGAETNGLLVMTSASALTLTLPDNATTPLPVGSRLFVVQGGAGQVTVAGAVGVTVGPADGLSLRAQYSMVKLVKIATDTWVIEGDTNKPGSGGSAGREVRSDVQGNFSYVGSAPDTATDSSSTWKITRINLGVSPIVVQSASNVTWNDRVTATYS